MLSLGVSFILVMPEVFFSNQAILKKSTFFKHKLFYYFLVVTLIKNVKQILTYLGAIFIIRKDIGVGGRSRKWQFSLTLCSDLSLRRWVVVKKSLKTTLHNIKMAPYMYIPIIFMTR